MRIITILSMLLLAACQNPSTENTPVVNAQTDTSYDPEAKLAELGIELPEAATPVANYVNAVRTRNLLFLAGKGPKDA